MTEEDHHAYEAEERGKFLPMNLDGSMAQHHPNWTSTCTMTRRMSLCGVVVAGSAILLIAIMMAGMVATGVAGESLPAFPYRQNMPMPGTWTPQKHNWTPPGGFRYAEYTNGSNPYFHAAPGLQNWSDHVARARREHVQKSMQFAYSAYTKCAFGMDELQPVTHQSNNRWGGMATTMMDSLDTLWLMGMKKDFWQARNYIRNQTEQWSTMFDIDGDSIVFEVTIRNLASLLSAYDWSHDPIFLDTALDLGQRLIRAFDDTWDPNTSTFGLPMGMINLKTGKARNGDFGLYSELARMGTLQLEFRWLDAFVGTNETAEMRQKVESVYQILHDIHPPHGLYAVSIYNVIKGNMSGAIPDKLFANDVFTFGGGADSFYEYLLKAWIQGGKTEHIYRDMYDTAIQGLHDVLLQQSSPSGLWYLASLQGHDNTLDHSMGHLACFAGGMLALGAYTDPTGFQSQRAQRDLKTAKALTYTCYQMYARMNTGIGPESARFYAGYDFEAEVHRKEYILRPEVVESLFVLHQITRDPIYREWGWEIYQAIETYCKTDVAYGALEDVTDPNKPPTDSMESFFFAETLKYLYLLFDPDSPVDILQAHVFNTEAHPMRVFSKILK